MWWEFAVLGEQWICFATQLPISMPENCRKKETEVFRGCVCWLEPVFKILNSYNHAITVWQCTFPHRAKANNNVSFLQYFSSENLEVPLIAGIQAQPQASMTTCLCLYHPSQWEMLRHAVSCSCYSVPCQITLQDTQRNKNMPWSQHFIRPMSAQIFLQALQALPALESSLTQGHTLVTLGHLWGHRYYLILVRRGSSNVFIIR